MLLKLTDEDGESILVNFQNVLSVQTFPPDESEGKGECTLLRMIDGEDIYVQDDLDVILLMYRNEWKRT